MKVRCSDVVCIELLEYAEDFVHLLTYQGYAGTAHTTGYEPAGSGSNTTATGRGRGMRTGTQHDQNVGDCP